MRAFIALEISEKIREILFAIANSFYKQNLFSGKITEKENIHLTLKFLGEIDDEAVELIKERLRKIKEKKFSAELKELGVFNENFVRIIWICLAGCDNLQKEIDDKLTDLFEKEKRFMGHVTIARVKECDREKLLEEIKKIRIDNKFDVEKFVLFSSELKKEGPVYSKIEE